MPTFIPLRITPSCPTYIDNTSGKVTDLIPYCFVDTPTMDYQDWLVGSEKQGFIANLKSADMKIAIVGAGMGGLSMGFELLRSGFTNFTIYEATDRIGGRFRSHYLGNDSNIAELGAMRFPPSENCLYWYIKYLQEAYDEGRHTHQIKLQSDFPDPGLVPTLVSYKDNTYLEGPGQPTPEEFKTVHDGWNDFVSRMEDIELGDGTTLPAPAQIMAWLDKSSDSYDAVRAFNAWQTYLNIFKDKPFVEGIEDIFCQPNAPGGTPWQYPEDIDKFGTVGTGIGGFAPMFEISFVDMMRFTLNRLEECQALITTGTGSVAEAMADCTFDIDGEKHCVRDYIQLNSPVGHIVPTEDQSQIILKTNEGILGDDFTHVVLATTHRSAEIDMKIDPRWQNPAATSVRGSEEAARMAGANEQLISMAAMQAIVNLHIAQSSKIFLNVKPWWRGEGNEDKIRCISSDTTLANFYTLDYGDPEYGVCLMNYTWEDFSEKSEALKPLNDRYQRLLDDLKNIAPQYIIDSMPESVTEEDAVMIDWQNEKHYYGAFQLTYPFQEKLLATLFYDFENKTSNSKLAKLYFVGDSYHWTGGWVEGALQTSLNAFSAIASSVGANPGSSNPLNNLKPSLYSYDNHANNFMVTAFGPYGGTGGNGPHEINWNGTDPVNIYVIDEGHNIARITALEVGSQSYGTKVGSPIPVNPNDLKNASSIKIYVFTSDERPTFTTGRLRCIEVNGTVYGAGLQGDEFSYNWSSATPNTVTSFKLCSGDNIDRLGMVIQKNLP